MYNCDEKSFIIESSNESKVAIRGNKRVDKIIGITMARARNNVFKGGIVYLTYVTEPKIMKREIHNVEVVKEYYDVFPDEFLGLPSDQEVEFTIDVALGSNPVARTP